MHSTANVKYDDS